LRSSRRGAIVAASCEPKDTSARLPAAGPPRSTSPRSSRRASPWPCEAIFQRSVEIELRAQNVTDPKIVAERAAAVRAARGDALIEKCVGRRITDRAVACVRQANTPAEVDGCLQ